MSKYKVIFRADLGRQSEACPIMWEPGCPIVFEAVQVSRNTESGEAYLQSKVKNIAGSEISTFAAVAQCRYFDGSDEEIEIKPLDADIPTGCSYTCSPVKLRQGDVREITATVKSASLVDGEWSSKGEAGAPLPYRKPLELSETALKERELLLGEAGCAEAGKCASCQITLDDNWVLCLCGKPSIGLKTCPWCGFEFSKIDSVLTDESSLGMASRQRALS